MVFFDSSCRAALLYSSRASIDVLLLDELRAAEAASNGRVQVHHTLTDASASMEGADPWSSVPKRQNFHGKHGNFASFFQPFKPKGGPLRTAVGQEAELRGRVDRAMLRQLMPAPGPGTRVVVCGPQGFLDSVSEALLALGHMGDSVVQLRATSMPMAGGNLEVEETIDSKMNDAEGESSDASENSSAEELLAPMISVITAEDSAGSVVRDAA